MCNSVSSIMKVLKLSNNGYTYAQSLSEKECRMAERAIVRGLVEKKNVSSPFGGMTVVYLVLNKKAS